MRLFLSLLAASLLAPNLAQAANGCGTPACRIRSHSCGNCGAKACKIVCQIEKVKKTVWAVECEEFCPMLPGSGPLACKTRCKTACKPTCDTNCNQGCNACPGKDPCKALRNRPIVPPKYAQARARKKLVKKTVTCEVPVYKCVVTQRCSQCDTGKAVPQAAPAAPLKKLTIIPPQPAPMFAGR